LDFFAIDVIKDYPYNCGKIVQVLWKEDNKNIYFYFEGVWNDVTWLFSKFHLCFEPSCIPPLKILYFQQQIKLSFLNVKN
jgi:hypothetical protein